MDPISVGVISAALSGLISGGAGVAGARALESFEQLRLRAGAGKGPPSTPDEAAAVAERLVASARADAQLARDLTQWLSEAQAVLASTAAVTNSVSGVVIGSSVVQTGISTTK
jgi:hypothetical protein